MEVEKDACGVGFIYCPQASHLLLQKALKALANLEHRGGLSADNESGDGAGLLTAIPWDLLEAEAAFPVSLRAEDRNKQNLALGMLFIPPEHLEFCREMTEHFFKLEGLSPLGWRSVPVIPFALGRLARQTMPLIEQILVGAAKELSKKEFELKLLSARRRMTNYLWSQPFKNDYFVVSLSCRSIVYKAMSSSQALSEFYPDLKNELFKSNYAVFHRRFSTNTTPKWWLSQPFRFLGHNGEINTLAGNRIWAQARAGMFEDAQLLTRNQVVLHPEGSDSANLDNILELFIAAGLKPEAALMCLLPEAPATNADANDPVRAFYEFNAALQEPWDGPALIAFSDGKSVGAILDRNGLRPARFCRFKDGTFLLCSESGVLDEPEAQIVERGRLGPGQMILLDLETGEIFKDRLLKERVAAQRPYSDWVFKNQIQFNPGRYSEKLELDSDSLLFGQVCAGMGKEDLEHLMLMAQDASEPIWSMGDDSALPFLSRQPRVLFDHFRQRFAQVTNPPIDSLRERLVMSLNIYLGKKQPLLNPQEGHALLIKCTSPLLSEADLQAITALSSVFTAQRVSLLAPADGFDLLEQLNRICDQALAAQRQGHTLIILSDKNAGKDQIAVPVLAAVGALHHFLISTGVRLSCSIIVESYQFWKPHQLACLLAYGAQGLCPYLAFESIKRLCLNPVRKNSGSHHILPDAISAQKNYRRAMENSLLKVMAKMGVSVLGSYIGAQLFETLGLSKSVVERCFPGTAAHIGGIGFAEIAQDMLRFRQSALAGTEIIDYGQYRFRKDGEFHGNNPELVKTLHRAVGLKDQGLSANEKTAIFGEYSKQILQRPAAAVRDLFEIVSDRKPIAISEVEPASSLVKRFCTGGMSLGALSPEMHETLAVAMNRLGAKSNSGEGGEDPRRFRAVAKNVSGGEHPHFPGLKGLKEGDSSGSAVRQVASGRFGVTPEYLVTAKQIEIKIAQGAKPGEGGQLPGHKVTDYIGKLRRAREGTTLISPPPHHDIYSIEDLAQLIYDLKQLSHKSMISVKLVSSSGIGTIAAGVAKANADIIQISGHEGGTGASPVSSIKHAGMPWEIGLAEVQRTLVANKLRDRVLLRVDGGLRTGFDVMVAALLGAEEFGFGSMVLVAAGCIMARLCHTNNCPVGVASQKEQLRKKFPGRPEQIESLLLFIAEELRFLLANLGYRRLEELIGRSDLLQFKHGVELSKASEIDLAELLSGSSANGRDWLQSDRAPHQNAEGLDQKILADSEFQKALEKHGRFSASYRICNRDRSIGAAIAGCIAGKYGDHGFRGKLTLKFNGSAGQSFAAFNLDRQRLLLSGEANDYVGKGMNGGLVVLSSLQKKDPGVIAGNACLYGATGGQFFCAGSVGERFAVRNAGALAVVEGVGNHCCEYMTGGLVLVLGPCGENFAAGMTGGEAYVLDQDGTLKQKLNSESRLDCTGVSDDAELKRLVRKHYRLSGSKLAAEILSDWTKYLPSFLRITPLAAGKESDSLRVDALLSAGSAITERR